MVAPCAKPSSSFPLIDPAHPVFKVIHTLASTQLPRLTRQLNSPGISMVCTRWIMLLQWYTLTCKNLLTSAWNQVPFAAKKGVQIHRQQPPNRAKDGRCMNYRPFQAPPKEARMLRDAYKTGERSRLSSVFLAEQLYVQGSSIWHRGYIGKMPVELCTSQITQFFFCSSLCRSQLCVTPKSPVQCLHRLQCVQVPEISIAGVCNSFPSLTFLLIQLLRLLPSAPSFPVLHPRPA